MIKLIVGLGNPGNQYLKTRHNVGFMLLDRFSQKGSGLNWKKGFKGEWAESTYQDNKIYFLKPQTFMNLSGESVAEFSRFYKIESSEILIIHDELDIPFGEIAFKKGGGLGGHNGLKSVAQLLGKQDFLRMRIGISRPTVGDVVDWVLSNFSGDENISLDIILEKSSEALKLALLKGFEIAAANYSRKKLISI